MAPPEAGPETTPPRPGRVDSASGGVTALVPDAASATGTAPTTAVLSSDVGRAGRDEPLLLTLEDVSVVFQTRKGFFRAGQVRAVDGVSLAVARGETLALVGESGSGKTTLGRVSLRLLRPTAGRVLFDGRDITTARDEDLHWLRRRAQIVFQDPFSSLNPYMRVADLVEEPLVIDGVRNRSERLDRVHRALAAVDLLPRPSSPPSTRRRCRAVSASASVSPAPSSATPTTSSPTSRSR